tara:strand:- start:538 stop:843 length:306 start_codon:yes stop_codon:yes gene_type:complete
MGDMGVQHTESVDIDALVVVDTLGQGPVGPVDAAHEREDARERAAVDDDVQRDPMPAELGRQQRVHQTFERGEPAPGEHLNEIAACVTNGGMEGGECGEWV